jgi:hypothetical protein
MAFVLIGSIVGLGLRVGLRLIGVMADTAHASRVQVLVISASLSNLDIRTPPFGSIHPAHACGAFVPASGSVPVTSGR